MSPLDVSRATPISTASELDCWLRDHGATERELIIAIFKKASGNQTVTFDELLETALCHGWVDTQTKSIDDERYAISRELFTAAAARDLVVPHSSVRP